MKQLKISLTQVCTLLTLYLERVMNVNFSAFYLSGFLCLCAGGGDAAASV